MTKYVDTNILARLMTNDALDLSAQAAAKVNDAAYGELYIMDAVLVELFFVLETNALYKLSHATIAELFEKIILPTPQFVVSTEANAALLIYKSNPKLGFMDCLLAVKANYKKSSVLTFDKDLLKTLH